MPICYGGIKNISQIEKIISLGIEKVALSGAAINNLDLIRNAAIYWESKHCDSSDMKKSCIQK